MSKLNKRMTVRRLISSNVLNIVGIVIVVAMLMTTLTTEARNTSTSYKVSKEYDIVFGKQIEGLDIVLSVDTASVESKPIVLTTSAVGESFTINDNDQEETEVEIYNEEADEESIIEDEEENIEEEVITEPSEEVVEEVPHLISEYWPVTEDQLNSYFGYVPEDWELAYWEATIMAECRGEPEEGIKAVADCIGYVRTNTDERFPNTIYGVITEKHQFSTWANGDVEKWLGETSDVVHNICVNQIQNGHSYDAAFFTAGCYNKYCDPGFTIGNHYFGY